MVTTTQTLNAPGGQVMESLLSVLHINGAIVVRPREAPARTRYST